MTNLLLLLILAAVIAIAFILDSIGKRLNNPTDLSKEDEAVKLSTEEVEAAKQRIPSDKQPTK